MSGVGRDVENKEGEGGRRVRKTDKTQEKKNKVLYIGHRKVSVVKLTKHRTVTMSK